MTDDTDRQPVFECACMRVCVLYAANYYSGLAHQVSIDSILSVSVHGVISHMCDLYSHRRTTGSNQELTIEERMTLTTSLPEGALARDKHNKSVDRLCIKNRGFGTFVL